VVGFAPPISSRRTGGATRGTSFQSVVRPEVPGSVWTREHIRRARRGIGAHRAGAHQFIAVGGIDSRVGRTQCIARAIRSCARPAHRGHHSRRGRQYLRFSRVPIIRPSTPQPRYTSSVAQHRSPVPFMKMDRVSGDGLATGVRRASRARVTSASTGGCRAQRRGVLRTGFPHAYFVKSS